MDNPYDVYSWNMLYRQEALEKARVRHLIEQAIEAGGDQGLDESRGGLFRMKHGTTRTPVAPVTHRGT